MYLEDKKMDILVGFEGFTLLVWIVARRTIVERFLLDCGII